MVSELYDYMTDNYHGYCATEIEESVRNHLISFAAEEARYHDTVEKLSDYAKRFGYDY